MWNRLTASRTQYKFITERKCFIVQVPDTESLNYGPIFLGLSVHRVSQKLKSVIWARSQSDIALQVSHQFINESFQHSVIIMCQSHCILTLFKSVVSQSFKYIPKCICCLIIQPSVIVSQYIFDFVSLCQSSVNVSCQSLWMFVILKVSHCPVTVNPGLNPDHQNFSWPW